MEQQIYLSDFMATVIEDMETGKRLKFRQSCKVAEGYIINFRSALVRLKEYETMKGKRCRLEEVDMAFQRDFVGFLVSKRIKPNTIKTRMSSIHTVMREATVRGMTKSDAYDDPDFIPLPEAVDSVYLTEEQIDELERLDVWSWEGYTEGIRLSEKVKSRLEKVRDILLMGCMTGQRFSDFMRIEESMVVRMGGYRFVSLRQRKTGVRVMIPMNVKMEKLLEKHNGRMPKMGLQRFNRNVRVLGEMMGWTWRPDTAKGKVRFCDMLSSHTARRSFATNAYQKGVPLKSIMAVTGHRSERSLRTYLRLGTKEKALMAARDFGAFLQMGVRR